MYGKQPIDVSLSPPLSLISINIFLKKSGSEHSSGHARSKLGRPKGSPALGRPKGSPAVGDGERVLLVTAVG